MAYIIDTYNKFSKWDKQHSVYVFEINKNWYAIKEVQLIWGQPQLPIDIEDHCNPNSYFIYDTKEQAMTFVRQMKSLN